MPKRKASEVSKMGEEDGKDDARTVSTRSSSSSTTRTTRSKKITRKEAMLRAKQAMQKDKEKTEAARQRRKSGAAPVAAAKSPPVTKVAAKKSAAKPTATATAIANANTTDTASAANNSESPAAAASSPTATTPQERVKRRRVQPAGQVTPSIKQVPKSATATRSSRRKQMEEARLRAKQWGDKQRGKGRSKPTPQKSIVEAEKPQPAPQSLVEREDPPVPVASPAEAQAEQTVREAMGTLVQPLPASSPVAPAQATPQPAAQANPVPGVQIANPQFYSPMQAPLQPVAQPSSATPAMGTWAVPQQQPVAVVYQGTLPHQPVAQAIPASQPVAFSAATVASTMQQVQSGAMLASSTAVVPAVNTPSQHSIATLMTATGVPSTHITTQNNANQDDDDTAAMPPTGLTRTASAALRQLPRSTGNMLDDDDDDDDDDHQTNAAIAINQPSNMMMHNGAVAAMNNALNNNHILTQGQFDDGLEDDDDDDDDDEAMPPPPTMALEKQISQQVMANCAAALKGQPLPFTAPPPEAFSSEPNNANQDDYVDFDEEPIMVDPDSIASHQDILMHHDGGILEAQPSVASRFARFPILITIALVAVICAFTLIDFAPILTTTTTDVAPCFLNSHLHMLTSSQSEDGEEIEGEEAVEAVACPEGDGVACPVGGVCEGGKLIACSSSNFEVSEDGTRCLPTKSTNDTIGVIRGILEEWTIEDQCGSAPSETLPVFPYADLQTAKPGVLGEWTLERGLLDEDFVIEYFDDGAFVGLPENHGVQYPVGCRLSNALKQLMAFAGTGIISMIIAIAKFSLVGLQAYPLGSLIGLIAVLFVYRRQEQHRKRKSVMRAVAEARQFSYERLMEDPSQSHVVLHIRDEIAMTMHPNSRKSRNELNYQIWPHVVTDIKCDNRVRKTIKILEGKQREVWQWIAAPSANKGKVVKIE